MSNPVKVEIPKNAWTLVASNVSSGLITIRQWQPSTYYQTYRVTGNPAPTGDQNEDTSTITTGREITISANENIDVYLFSKDVDGEVVLAL